MARDAVVGRVTVRVGIDDTPRQPGRRAIVHSIEKTTDSANRGSDRHGRREQVREAAERNPRPAGIYQGGDDCSEQPTEKREPALPERKNSPWLAKVFTHIVLDHVIQTSADHGA